MKRFALGVIATILLLASVLATPLLMAQEETAKVTITAIGADGRVLKNAKVTLYDSQGNEYSNTTNETGVTVIEVPINSYLVVVKSEYYILDVINVSGNMSYTVDASAMYYANITAEPISVDATVALVEFEGVNLTLTTNVKVFAPSSINVSFPHKVVKFPWRYVLQNITFDNTIVENKNYVVLDMASDYVVKAKYSQEFYFMLEWWMVGLLVLIFIIAIAVAWSAGARTARALIEEYRANGRFVRKK